MYLCVCVGVYVCVCVCSEAGKERDYDRNLCIRALCVLRAFKPIVHTLYTVKRQIQHCGCVLHICAIRTINYICTNTHTYMHTFLLSHSVQHAAQKYT